MDSFRIWHSLVTITGGGKDFDIGLYIQEDYLEMFFYKNKSFLTHCSIGRVRYLSLTFSDLYASAFRLRRHYVFGLSVRPSVRSLKYPLLTCTWVRWSTRPTVTVLRHVRPSVRLSVRPSGEVSGHFPENAWRD